jgi:hypothetical protein
MVCTDQLVAETALQYVVELIALFGCAQRALIEHAVHNSIAACAPGGVTNVGSLRSDSVQLPPSSCVLARSDIAHSGPSCKSTLQLIIRTSLQLLNTFA